MKKDQYFVHYRDDGPKDEVLEGAKSEAWSCLYVFDDFEEVVEWQEQEFQKLARQRVHARVENRWSTKYNLDQANSVILVESVRQKLQKRLRPPRTFRPGTRQKKRFETSLK